jgi:hypothetical protein
MKLLTWLTMSFKNNLIKPRQHLFLLFFSFLLFFLFLFFLSLFFFLFSLLSSSSSPDLFGASRTLPLSLSTQTKPPQLFKLRRSPHSLSTQTKPVPACGEEASKN